MTSSIPLLSVDRLSLNVVTREGVLSGFDHVSFDRFKGDMLAAVGESGSGRVPYRGVGKGPCVRFPQGWSNAPRRWIFSSGAKERVVSQFEI